MDLTETISASGVTFAYIVRSQLEPLKTQFVTPEDQKQQVGFIVYPAGGEVARHYHLPIERRIVGTSEVLIVRKGRCEIDIYDNNRILIATRELLPGDIMVMVSGGHGFRMLEDTVMLEVKQGPYVGIEEKIRF